MYDESVDQGRHTLQTGEEEVLLSRSQAMSRFPCLVVASDRVVPTRCAVVVIARLESPPWRRGQPDNSQGSPGGARQSHEYYQLRTAKGFSLEHCEPIMLGDSA